MNRMIIAKPSFILLVGLFCVSGCVVPVAENPPQHGEPGSAGGNLEITFLLPKFRGWDYGSHGSIKVIDPQTASVYVRVNGQMGPVYEQTLAFSSTDINDHGFYKSWQMSIEVPFGSYGAGDILIVLLDAGGTPLVTGSNLETVNLKLGATVPVTIGCLPQNAAHIPVGVDAASGGVGQGFVAYLEFLAVYGERYDIEVTRTGGTGEPDLYLFNSHGAPVAYDYASGGSAGISSYQARNNGIFYVGVFGYGGEVAGFDVAVTNTGTPLLTHPVINELYFNPRREEYPWPQAIELFNPTSQDIDISGCSIVIARQWDSYTVFAPAGIVLPARGYFVVFSEQPRDERFELLNMHYGWDVSGPGWWWSQFSDDVSVKLRDASAAETDFVRLNASVTPGSWTGANFSASSCTVAREVPTGPGFDTDTASDWQNSWGTLGLPNDYSGDVPVIIDVQ